MLPIVVAIVLPGGFLAELPGVMGANSDCGFLVFGVIPVAIVAPQVWAFKRNKRL